jgi:DNA-binding transcriptional ArsR family regulator
LGDPVRLRIVQSLDQQGEQNCSAMGATVSKPTLSYHYKVLREAGLIYTRIEGTQHLSSVRRADLETRFPGLLDALLAAAAL